jgi:TP901-1 family phage major tail protein
MAEAAPVLFVLGMNGKLYFGTSGGELSALTVMDNVKDVTGTMERGEADITTRANSGWKATAPTLASCTLEWEMVWKPGDSGFDAIKTAFLTAGTLELAALDNVNTDATAGGIKGTFCVTNFSRKEALEEAMTVSVTCKLTKFDKFLPVAA